MKEARILTKTKGINSAVNAKQLSWKPGVGCEFLEAAVNVDITDGYRVSRRKGFVNVLAGDYHSFYQYHGTGYCIKDDDLVSVTPGYAVTTLRASLGTEKVRYCGIGDKIFYSNGIVNGFIHENQDYAWAPSAYVGPDTTKEYIKPPVCRHLTLHQGRLYMSNDSDVFYTDPFSYLSVNLATGFFQLDSPIRMLTSIGSILVIATIDKVYLYTGDTPELIAVKDVLSLKMLEDTDVVSKDTIENVGFAGNTLVFTAINGVFAVFSSGEIVELTENRLRLSEANSGNAYISDGVYTVFINE